MNAVFCLPSEAMMIFNKDNLVSLRITIDILRLEKDDS